MSGGICVAVDLRIECIKKEKAANFAAFFVGVEREIS